MDYTAEILTNVNEMIKRHRKSYFNVAPGVWGMKIIFVNVYMIRQYDDWVLIDAGLKGSAGKIIKMAVELFGDKKRPKAIILTHGHFDHLTSY